MLSPIKYCSGPSSSSFPASSFSLSFSTCCFRFSWSSIPSALKTPQPSDSAFFSSLFLFSSSSSTFFSSSWLFGCSSTIKCSWVTKDLVLLTCDMVSCSASGDGAASLWSSLLNESRCISMFFAFLKKKICYVFVHKFDQKIEKTQTNKNNVITYLTLLWIVIELMKCFRS